MEKALDMKKLLVLIEKLDDNNLRRFDKLKEELDKIIERLEKLEEKREKEEEPIKPYLEDKFKELALSLEKLGDITDLIKKLKENNAKFNKKVKDILEKIENLEENLSIVVLGVKDLYEFEDKLNKLIKKIDNWNKIFDIEEIEYHEERINLIKNWIKDQLKKGYNIEDIKEELIKNGYSTFFINKVLNSIEKSK